MAKVDRQKLTDLVKMYNITCVKLAVLVGETKKCELCNSKLSEKYYQFSCAPKNDKDKNAIKLVYTGTGCGETLANECKIKPAPLFSIFATEAAVSNANKEDSSANNQNSQDTIKYLPLSKQFLDALLVFAELRKFISPTIHKYICSVHQYGTRPPLLIIR